MTEDDRKESLTDEEIQEKMRARKARARWGTLFVVVGVVGFALTAGGLLLSQRPIGIGELTVLGMFFAMGAVGAGYADPSELKSFWK